MRLLTQEEINEYRRTPGPFEAMVQAIHDHAWVEGRAQAPAWHDAPTCPGLWLYRITGNATQINAANIHAYQHLNDGWFGPIPPSNL